VDFILNERSELFKEYIDSFDSLWIRKEQKDYFEKSLNGFLSETKRKNIERLSEKIIDQDYQSLHHFITNSPWDREKMNEIRIKFLREETDAYPEKKSVLVIDDSGVVKRGTATEGVGYQYIGQVGKVANGNVFVTSHLVNEHRHIPLDIEDFVPEDKTKSKEEQGFERKVDIAIRLIQKAIDRGHTFEFVLADAWYGSSPDFIRFLESKNLKYVLSIKTNRKIFYKFPNENKSYEHKVSELLTLIKPEQFRPIDIKLSDGSLLRKYFCRMDLKIKGLSGKQRVIIEADTVENISLNDVNFLISNAKELRDDTVVKYYHLRNWIEVFYREVKDCLGADDYQVRSMDKILRHWTLCITTYSMIQWLQFGRKLKEYVKKNE
jgi:SRSO17 transposase